MVQVRLFPLYSNFSPSSQHSVSCVIVILRETSCIRRVSVSNVHIFSIYLHRGQGSKLLYRFDEIRLFSFATNNSSYRRKLNLSTSIPGHSSCCLSFGTRDSILSLDSKILLISSARIGPENETSSENRQDKTAWIC